jgi:hypothetical protein
MNEVERHLVPDPLAPICRDEPDVRNPLAVKVRKLLAGPSVKATPRLA